MTSMADFSAASLSEKLNFLYRQRRNYGADSKFRPAYIELIEKLGNPHHHLPPTIHVAGTNGKGSTIAFMRAVLQTAGYKVHAYTSPHLLRPNERIQLARQEISDQLLEFLIDEAMKRCPDRENVDLSFFEFFTACALTAFAHTPGDVLLLETGLGGRLDSTNIIRYPIMNIITTLSYDHTEILGDTIAKIAGEKAGIMKPGAPCVIGHQIYPEATSALIKIAKENNITAYVQDQDWSYNVAADGLSFSITVPGYTLEAIPMPHLHGKHQLNNAAVAIAALLIQKHIPIPPHIFAEGLSKVAWPARLQKIDTHMLADGWELWLDGGHNDSAALVLADQARAWQETDGKPLHIITAMMGHKDAAAFAGPLASLVTSVTSIQMPEQKEDAIPPDILARVWSDAGATVSQALSAQPLPELLQTLSHRTPAGRILITGSLHLAQLLDY